MTKDDAVFASGRFDYAAVNEELRAEAIETRGRKDLLYGDLTLNDCIDFVIDQIFAGIFPMTMLCGPSICATEIFCPS